MPSTGKETKPCQRPCRRGKGHGMGLEGRKTVWNTVLVRAAEQWGDLDAIPGGGETTHAMQNVRETELGILKAGK